MIVDFQLRALKEVPEVILGDEPSTPFISDLEELCSVFDLAARDSFDQLVDDVLLSGVKLEPESFELSTELRHADVFTGVDIHCFPKDFNLVVGQLLATDLQDSFQELGELLLLQHSVFVVVKLSEHLLGAHLGPDENLGNLGEDLVLPPEDRVVALQSLGKDLDLCLEVPFDVLVDLVVKLCLLILPAFFLEELDLLVELDLLLDQGVVLHL